MNMEPRVRCTDCEPPGWMREVATDGSGDERYIECPTCSGNAHHFEPPAEFVEYTREAMREAGRKALGLEDER